MQQVEFRFQSEIFHQNSAHFSDFCTCIYRGQCDREQLMSLELSIKTRNPIYAQGRIVMNKV